MSSQKRSLPWFGVFSSSLIGNYVFSSTTAPLENITRFATSSASKTHSIFNSSRTMKTEYHEQKLTGIRPSGVIRADDGGFETYTRLVVRTNPLNNTEVVSNKAKTVVGRSSRISLPVNSTQLMTFSNSSISLVSVHLQSSSSMEEMENTTNSSVESTDSDLLLIILVPVVAVVVLIAAAVLLHIYWKKRKLRNRSRTLERNLETNLSWFEAFDFQNSVGSWSVMNDSNEPAEFSIPMGPLCMNNFAFDNYKTTMEDSMMDRYSTKSILSRDFSQIKRGSEVHPAERAFSKGFELEKAKVNQVSRSTHVNTGAEFETTNT